jgi:hypothetical protein
MRLGRLVRCFWDGGFTWKLGDDANGYVAVGDARTVEDALTQLTDAALKHFPESDFAKKFQRLPTLS